MMIASSAVQIMPANNMEYDCFWLMSESLGSKANPSSVTAISDRDASQKLKDLCMSAAVSKPGIPWKLTEWKKPSIAVHKKATARMALLFFLESPKAFQQTIKTDAKITIVTVSKNVCIGSGWDSLSVDSSAWFAQKKHETRKRTPTSQHASCILCVVFVVVEDIQVLTLVKWDVYFNGKRWQNSYFSMWAIRKKGYPSYGVPLQPCGSVLAVTFCQILLCALFLVWHENWYSHAFQYCSGDATHNHFSETWMTVTTHHNHIAVQIMR